MRKRLLPLILLLPGFYAQARELNHLPKVTVNITKPYLAREAKITPEEYPIAQSIRPLLEQENYTQAVTTLADHTAPKSPALNLLYGQLLMQEEKWQEAEQAMLLALAEMPDLLRAHNSLASIYQIQEQPEKARQSVARAISLGAMEKNNFAMLAYLNMQLNDPHAAIAAYQQALMLDPQDKDIRQGLLYALVNSNQFNAASALLSGMLQSDPENKKLWLQRANLAFQSKQNKQALSSIEVAMRLGESGAAARQLAMQLHLKQDNYPGALTLAKGLIADNLLSVSDTDKLLVWLQRKGQWNHFEVLLTHIESQNRKKSALEQGRYWFHKASLALSKNRSDKAQQALMKAVSIDAGNGEALLALATLSSKRTAFAEAELFYLRAEQVAAVAMQAKIGRAQLYINQLDYPSALALLEKTLREHPQRSDLKDNIAVLRHLVKNTTS